MILNRTGFSGDFRARVTPASRTCLVEMVLVQSPLTLNVVANLVANRGTLGDCRGHRLLYASVTSDLLTWPLEKMSGFGRSGDVYDLAGRLEQVFRDETLESRLTYDINSGSATRW